MTSCWLHIMYMHNCSNKLNLFWWLQVYSQEGAQFSDTASRHVVEVIQNDCNLNKDILILHPSTCTEILRIVRANCVRMRQYDQTQKLAKNERRIIYIKSCWNQSAPFSFSLQQPSFLTAILAISSSLGSPTKSTINKKRTPASSHFSKIF